MLCRRVFHCFNNFSSFFSDKFSFVDVESCVFFFSAKLVICESGYTNFGNGFGCCCEVFDTSL